MVGTGSAECVGEMTWEGHVLATGPLSAPHDSRLDVLHGARGVTTKGGGRRGAFGGGLRIRRAVAVPCEVREVRVGRARAVGRGPRLSLHPKRRGQERTR